MSSGLPGVRVGPLDPEATKEFGQVAQTNSARTLIRLHRQMYPPQLLRALARKEDVPRGRGLDLDEVREYVGGLEHPNGDPLVPDGARVVGATVRGDEAVGRVLTFQYQLPSGRVGKWHAPYSEEHLPVSFANGSERARIQEMRDRGLVSFDESATDKEILRRQLAASRQENETLRRMIEGGEEPAEGEELPGAAGHDLRAQAGHLEELEQLRRSHQEIMERNGKLEALLAQATGAGGGGVPTGGLEADVEDRARQGQPAGDGSGEPAAGEEGARETVASQEPPLEGYDTLNADAVVARIKSEDTSDDEVRAIVEYERSHAARRTVVSAGEQRLDRSSG